MVMVMETNIGVVDGDGDGDDDRDYEAPHHDLHGAPAGCPPVHGHSLVYYERHGADDLCKSQLHSFSTRIKLLLHTLVLKTTKSGFIYCFDGPDLPSIGLLTSFLLAKTMST